MTARTIKTLLLATAALSFTGCTSHWDMQGHDPKKYYAAHPIANKLESHEASYTVHFLPGQSRLADSEVEALRSSLRGVTPAGADAVTLHLSDSDMHNDARKQY